MGELAISSAYPLKKIRSKRAKKAILERFEKYIYYGLDGCWYWLGALTRGNYGVFSVNDRFIRANRASFLLYKKQDVTNLLVCHSCDNPMCVNPDHLFLGTHLDNHTDMDRKKRRTIRRGEKSNFCKISDEAVKHIRDNEAILTKKELSEIHGVGQTQIRRIQKFLRRPIISSEA